MALPLALLLRFAFLELFGICSVLIFVRHAAVKSSVEDLGRQIKELQGETGGSEPPPARSLETLKIRAAAL